jgi:hypothetical protein
MLNWKAVVKLSRWIFTTWRALRSWLFWSTPPSSQFYIFSFLRFLWLPFLFDFLPSPSSFPDVSPFLYSFTQCPGGCLSSCILSVFTLCCVMFFFPRFFSIHCSEVTLASFPASLFFFPASRWQRHAMAPDPVGPSFPSCASSRLSDVAVVYHLPLLYFIMLRSNWLAYSPWEPDGVLTIPHI